MFPSVVTRMAEERRAAMEVKVDEMDAVWWAEVCGEGKHRIGSCKNKLGRNLKKLFALPPAAAMSLYYEAAAILANADKVGGSLKSRIYTKKELKSPPAQIFALIAETSKWSIVLKDVIEKCRLLAEERKVRVE
jgi:hypothetical protein